MSARRLVDTALAVLAALLLGAGVAYWFAAAPGAPPVVESPPPEAEPAEEALDLEQLGQRVANELTMSSRSVLTDTGPMEGRESRLYQLDLAADTTYTVEVVCGGLDSVSVVLPAGAVLVACTPDPSAQEFGLTGVSFHELVVVNEGAGPVVIGIHVRPA